MTSDTLSVGSMSALIDAVRYVTTLIREIFDPLIGALPAVDAPPDKLAAGPPPLAAAAEAVVGWYAEEIAPPPPDDIPLAFEEVEAAREVRLERVDMLGGNLFAAAADDVPFARPFREP